MSYLAAMKNPSKITRSTGEWLPKFDGNRQTNKGRVQHNLLVGDVCFFNLYVKLL